MKAAAILPSRNEPATISAVTAAVDTALGNVPTVIVNADSSDTPTTTENFAATGTRAKKVPLAGLTRGKGAQILAAARRPELADAEVVLIADTDTRNPDPTVYAALLDHVRAGAALAIADYPRYWDEANLTNHLARPLIATTGHDVPQPLAGDLALSRQALAAVLRAVEALPRELSECVDGYGIDAFLLLTATAIGPLASIRIDRPKQHAGSFPHLPAIYHQAVPVLLHLTATRTPPPVPPGGEATMYRVSHRAVEPGRLQTMLTTLESLGQHPDGYDEHPWPQPAVDAWHAVRSGVPAVEAARWLWPHYLRRVADWLTTGEHATPRQRAGILATAHARLHTAVLTAAGARR
ncbi:hypothetical protein ACLMNJ_15100 [Streptomyces seoulensis]